MMEVSRLQEPRAFLIEPRCAVCGRPATHVELRPEDEGWRFIYRGIAGGNGGGDIIAYERASLNPPDFELMGAQLHPEAAWSPEPAILDCSCSRRRAGAMKVAGGHSG